MRAPRSQAQEVTRPKRVRLPPSLPPEVQGGIFDGEQAVLHTIGRIVDAPLGLRVDESSPMCRTEPLPNVLRSPPHVDLTVGADLRYEREQPVRLMERSAR